MDDLEAESEVIAQGKLQKLSSRKYGVRQPGARYALLVLTSINLLNYIDRFVPSAVKVLIKEDLNLTDAETSYPLTGMVCTYGCMYACL